MTPALSSQWEKSNCKFVHPVIIQEFSIKVKFWETAFKISLRNVKKSIKDRLTPKLGELIDILSCKCEMMFCSWYGCNHYCKKEVHVKCMRVRENKIPVLELSFIKLQRDKVGSCAHYHIGGVDIKESTKIKKVIQRKEKYCQELEKRVKKFKKKGKKINQKILDDYNYLAQIDQVIIKHVY